MADRTITLKRGGVQFELPADSITVDDVCALFYVERKGLHIKMKLGDDWVNESAKPDGRFELIGNVCYVVRKIYITIRILSSWDKELVDVYKLFVFDIFLLWVFIHSH